MFDDFVSISENELDILCSAWSMRGVVRQLRYGQRRTFSGSHHPGTGDLIE
jgi:hypothetical protein